MDLTACPFCQPLPPERVLAASDTFVAFFDGFPVTPGHTLVIPKRHVVSLFDLPEREYQELWAQVAEVRKRLVEKTICYGSSLCRCLITATQ